MQMDKSLKKYLWKSRVPGFSLDNFSLSYDGCDFNLPDFLGTFKKYFNSYIFVEWKFHCISTLWAPLECKYGTPLKQHLPQRSVCLFPFSKVTENLVVLLGFREEWGLSPCRMYLLLLRICLKNPCDIDSLLILLTF